MIFGDLDESTSSTIVFEKVWFASSNTFFDLSLCDAEWARQKSGKHEVATKHENAKWKKRQPSYSNRFDNNNNEIPHINTYINGDKNEKKTEEIGKQFAAASA